MGPLQPFKNAKVASSTLVGTKEIFFGKIFFDLRQESSAAPDYL